MSSGTSRKDPIATAVVGMGGYAGRIIDLLLRTESDDDHPPRLVAVTSSNPTRHPEMASRLAAHGVEICPSLDALLSREDVEVVWLPVPIDLHLPFLDRSLTAGKAVLCEKPAAGSVDACNLMIASRDRHGLPVAIGYQSIYDPSTTTLKRRIVAGDLGPISSATLRGVWPRDSTYYGRTDWSGRLKRNGEWVLDSPVQNGLNHFVNLTLFLLGPTAAESAVPVSVEAELYRANDIENYDTASIKVVLDTGATFLLLVTHAALETVHPVIRLTGERGTATWRFDGDITLRDAWAGAEETIEPLDVEAQRASMVSAFNRLARGTPDPDRSVATLEQARATLVAVNGASEAAPVHTVPASCIKVVEKDDGAAIRTIPGIEELFVQCAERGQMLHESGGANWTVPARGKDLSGYDHFAGPWRAGDD